MIDAFEPWLRVHKPSLDDKTVKGLISFIRKLAFVAEQAGVSLTEVDREMFERAARGRFEPGDYSQFNPDRASVSGTQTAKSAMTYFTHFLRASGLPDWPNPTEHASLPKQAGLSAPKAIPWKDVEAFLGASAERAGAALQYHFEGRNDELGKFDTTPMRTLRVVAGFVGLATAHLTGVRISELIGLRIGDVDLGAEAHVKVFRAKGDKHREVPIGRRLIGILGPYLAEVRHQINGAPESEVLLVDHQALGRRGAFPDDAMRAVQKWFWAECPRERITKAYAGILTSPGTLTPPPSWNRASPWAWSNTSSATPTQRQPRSTPDPPPTADPPVRDQLRRRGG